MTTRTNAARHCGHRRWHDRLAFLAFIGAVFGWLVTAPAPAWAAELSKESKACVECHDKPDIQKKKLGDGTLLSMAVSEKDFLASMHKDQDCTDCHSKLDEENHGKPGHETSLKNRREMAASMQETCRDCHQKPQKAYDDGLHATLIKDGNDKAPLCADCHNSHTLASVKVVAPIDKVPCGTCHDKIFAAYKQDVHGLERVKQGKASPICSDCHKSHLIQAASLGDGGKQNCLACHKQALDQHKTWLPNAGLHFEAVTCVACHAPNAARRVNLRLYDAASNTQLREKSGVPRFARRVQSGDATKMGLDERALFSLLEQFNADSAKDGEIIVRGRLELRDGLQAHTLVEKEKALKDCDGCHKQGAEPFQSVVLSIAGPDGRPLRASVQKDVLSSLTALESVRGFYAVGSTRIKMLDWLLALALAGTIGGCLAHAGMKRMTRGLRERLAAEARAEAAAASAAAAPAAGSAQAGPKS